MLVAIEIDSNTISNHLETLIGIHDISLWHLFDFTSILQHGKLLELLNGSGSTELLSHEERVILLWELKTESWVSNDDTS